MFFLGRELNIVPKAQQKLHEKYEREARERRLQSAIPWEPNIKFDQNLTIKADTYKPLELFKVKAIGPNPNLASEDELIVSPGDSFCYTHKLLPKGKKLDIFSGPKRGDVMFDGDIIIPALHERKHNTWDRDPWMSLTPMEMISLRGGTRRAKGDVVIAGLGLGHQLIEVSKRKKVNSITLIEKSEELVEWLLPEVKKHMQCELTNVIVGDAYEELPKLKADIALVDIFPLYGGNYIPEHIRRKCANIGAIWVWGSARVSFGDSW